MIMAFYLFFMLVKAILKTVDIVAGLPKYGVEVSIINYDIKIGNRLGGDE